MEVSIALGDVFARLKPGCTDINMAPGLSGSVELNQGMLLLSSGGTRSMLRGADVGPLSGTPRVKGRGFLLRGRN